MAGAYKDKKKEHTSHIYSVWVEPSYRGSGLAANLLLKLEDWSRDQKFTNLEGYVTETNLRARSFYKKLGFPETEGRISLRWDNSVGEILSRKILM